MNVNLLDKYIKGRTETELEPPTEGEAADDLGAFGWLRGVRERAVMLELRYRDGSVTALGYAWLERADFDPSEGITLEFGQTVVKITGTHLNSAFRTNVRLFSGIVRHRVPWIQEAEKTQLMESVSAAMIIEAITVE